MNRFLSCLLVLLGLGSARGAEGTARPNVILIAIDDLKPALGCYGDAAAYTPNLDRLAGRALRLDRAYCNQAVCAPSRNALMTSLRPQSLGIYDLSTHFRDSRPDAVTLAQYFRSQGYHTAAIGKILHTGHGNHDDADSWSDKPIHPRAEQYALPGNRPPGGGGSKGGDQRGAPTESADVSDDTYADGLIAAEAMKKLAAAREAKAPFFLAVGFLKPHLPFVAPKKYWDRIDPAKLPMPGSDTLPAGAPTAAGPNVDELRKYKGMPPGKEVLGETLKRHLIHGYYAATSYADACAGRVLDALEASGLADNTIVVVWGDHGYHLGDHGIWGKHTNFELAARIPLMVALPGKAGAASAALVETVDLYPTLAELAGLPAPGGLDGRSFASLFSNPAKAHRAYVSHIYPRRELLGNAVRNDRYRLVEWNKPGARPGTGVMELYDYQKDPGESANLAAAQPAIVAELQAILASQPALKPQLPRKAAAAAKPSEGTRKQAASDRAAQFHKMDKSKDGKLTYEEFALPQRDPSDAPQRFQKMDTDGDRALTEAEYVNKGSRPTAARAQSTSAVEMVAAHDRARILAAADAALGIKPFSITFHRSPLSEGGPHEFFSMSDYFWPDPSKPDGRPYVQRDGESYPGNFNEHRLALMGMRDATAALAAAYKISGEERYAARAVELLRVFFVDEATRMTPSLEHAQVMVGKPAPTRGIGLIDTLHLIEVPMAILALDGSQALTPELKSALVGWFRDYLAWFTSSPRGKDEGSRTNNHAVAYWLQVAAFNQLVGDQALHAECVRQFKDKFITVQMAADGSFPLETRRTKPYAYSIFQLDNLATLCLLLARTERGLWDFAGPEGRSMRQAMAWLQPYLEDKSRWPFQPDVQAWDDWPVRQASLLFGGLALGEEKYVALWRKLKPDPALFEMRRNNAITQPLLWVALPVE